MMDLVGISLPAMPAGRSQLRPSQSPRADTGKGAALASCLAGALLALAPAPARAALFSLAAAGAISGSTDATIPVGTPWAFEITYETDAPDLDFELTGSPTPEFGRYEDTSDPSAVTSFHYQAGDYEVTIDDPADFAAGEILITFSGVHAIDVNVIAPTLFPTLGGEEVSFHADFNDFSSRPIFTSDALPTDPAFSPDSFDEVEVSLLPAGSGEVSSVGLTTFTVSAVPEPSTLALEITSLVVLVAAEARCAHQRVEASSSEARASSA